MFFVVEKFLSNFFKDCIVVFNKFVVFLVVLFKFGGLGGSGGGVFGFVKKLFVVVLFSCNVYVFFLREVFMIKIYCCEEDFEVKEVEV